MRLSGYGEGEPSGPDTARRARREASLSGVGRDRPRPIAPRGGVLPRKEVIQPHLPVRLPCYDFTPVMSPTVVSALLAVKLPTSGKTHSHGVTGGVYKTRERIHRGMLIRDY